MYPNLIGELAKARITIDSMAELLGVHRNTVSNKLHGITPFLLNEAMLISTTYFPGVSLQWLFTPADKSA